MMLFDTYIAPSAIEGVGIFAAERIPAGSRIWTFDDRFDRLIARTEVADFLPSLQRFLQRYAYPLMTDPSYLVLESDNGRFMNHSLAPNTCFTDPRDGYASVEIPADTEITCNYNEFDPGYDMQPGRIFVDMIERAAAS